MMATKRKKKKKCGLDGRIKGSGKVVKVLRSTNEIKFQIWGEIKKVEKS